MDQVNEGITSDFETIGFSVRSPEEFEHVAAEAIETGEHIRSRRGYYVRWAPGAGAELWIHVNRRGEIVGCDPHFAGPARLRVRVTELRFDRRSPLTGSLHCWSEPEDDDSEGGLYPFVADVPGFDLIRDRLVCPLIVTLQVAAFPRELHCFADDDEFDAHQPTEHKLAPEAFLSAGLIDEALGHGSKALPGSPATAVFAGHVQQAEMRTNPATGNPLHCMSVRTYGGTFDVVASPDMVRKELVPGGVVYGLFWLSALVASDLPPPRRWSLRRLLGRG